MLFSEPLQCFKIQLELMRMEKEEKKEKEKKEKRGVPRNQTVTVSVSSGRH